MNPIDCWPVPALILFIGLARMIIFVTNRIDVVGHHSLICQSEATALLVDSD
jgi:hypothetical protein